MFQNAFHPLFDVDAPEKTKKKPPQMTCLNEPFNRSFFEMTFRHMMFLFRRGCPRTALEFGKFLLSLDMHTDPMGILLCLDGLAVQSREIDWFLDTFTKHFDRKILASLPGMSLSKALALALRHGHQSDVATRQLMTTLRKYPFLLVPLLKRSKLIDSERWKKCLSESKFWNEDDIPSIASKLATITAEIQADVWCAPRNAEWLLSVVKKSNQAEYAQYGSDSWRDTRALIRARFSNDSVVKHRYSSRSPYDYSDKSGGLDNVMLNNNNGAAAMQQQDTRVPLNLRDASSNPLMLFLQTMMPWNRVEIPEEEERAPVAAATTNAVEEEEKEEKEEEEEESSVRDAAEVDSDEMDDDI